MACCPPGSEPVSPQKYTAKGTEFKLNNEQLVYHSGSGTKGIIVGYEPFGFNGGRFRQICDEIAAAGFNVLMPAFFGDEHIDPDNPDWGKMTTMFNNTPWTKVEKILTMSVDYLKSKGATKFGVLGFCWGNWLVFHACGSDHFSCGVSAHPSAVFCCSNFKENIDELVAKIKSPQLVMPAGNDPPEMKEGGKFHQVLKAKGSVFKDFPNEKHGWVTRGDLNNPTTVAAVKEAIKLTIEFFNKHM